MLKRCCECVLQFTAILIVEESSRARYQYEQIAQSISKGLSQQQEVKNMTEGKNDLHST